MLYKLGSIIVLPVTVSFAFAFTLAGAITFVTSIFVFIASILGFNVTNKILNFSFIGIENGFLRSIIAMIISLVLLFIGIMSYKITKIYVKRMR